MSHMIDETTGRAAIAYRGEEPWHGLGVRIDADEPVESWTRKAGLTYSVKRTPVRFTLPEKADPVTFAGRDVLYRSDTRAALSVVSDGYRVVQPAVVMRFMAELMKHNGFQMEVAGVLDGGKRVWALARVNDGAPVVGHDIVRPYVLCATSYDGTMATIAKFTEIRVVCHNTITAAVGAFDAQTGRMSGGEKDKTAGAVVQCVRVPHSMDFDPESARMDLGIALDAHAEFMIRARILAETPVDERFVVEFLRELLPKPDRANGQPSRTFERLLATWKGYAPSATLPEAQGTAWGLLNAITWDVDHVRGGDRSRLGSSWFGSGEAMKLRALDLLTEVATS